MGGLSHFPDLYALDDVRVVACATAAQSATAKTCLCMSVRRKNLSVGFSEFNQLLNQKFPGF